MGIFSLDQHLDHDYVLGISVILWEDIYSQGKQNKSIYLIKLQISKHAANCAKECLGKKKKRWAKLFNCSHDEF